VKTKTPDIVMPGVSIRFAIKGSQAIIKRLVVTLSPFVPFVGRLDRVGRASRFVVHLIHFRVCLGAQTVMPIFIHFMPAMSTSHGAGSARPHIMSLVDLLVGLIHDIVIFYIFGILLICNGTV
jgi:hypothetical protein